MDFRKVVAAAAVIVSALGAGIDALAQPHSTGSGQPYPDRPVRIIVPWPPGGSTDVIGRIIGQRLTQLLGQNVVIDNRGGGAGAIGIEAASRATPDGYTLAIIEVAHALLPTTRARLPYDLMKDFTPVTAIGTSPQIVFVGVTIPVKSFAELIALARTKQGALLMAHTGQGSVSHLTSELLQQRTGTRFTQVGYKGAGPAFIELAGAQVQAYCATLASGSATLATGRITALAVAGKKRLDALPNVPTVAESGVPDFVVEQWWGVVAPARTPPDALARLHRDIVASVNDPQVRKRISDLAVEPETNTPQAFRAFLDVELKRWARVAKEAGIQPE